MQYNCYKDMLLCKQCNLHETRTNIVPGRGDPTSPLWFVGEAPGREEDETGVAFTGRAGRLLDRCLEKGGIDSFNIVNLLKCRPPDNRDPTEEEIKICTNTWLYKQIAEYHPRVFVAMGRYSIGFFRMYNWKRITTMKVGVEIKFGLFKHSFGFSVIPTYHPAYLLRNPERILPFIKQLRLAKELADKEKR